VIDRVKMVADIHRINKDLVGICWELMGSEPGTEEFLALTAVSDAIAKLEEYLYPEIASWSDDERYMDDGN
jgi:hypothetical protein